MRLKEPASSQTASNAASPLTAPKIALVAGLTWAVGAFVALYVWRASHWWIAGDDGYYHIRIAADLRVQGAWYFQTLDWTRMSVFHEGWGDKEYLFHLFLIPFAGGDLLFGAKAALALLNGITAGLLAYFGVRHAGAQGWLVPLMAVAMTASFPVRMEQLRPHSLSLILLLLIANAAASRRKGWLMVLGVAYALSYTAWHLPLILCVLVFFGFLFARREKRWELLWAPAIGIATGVLMHPGFPDNVRIWSLQNFQFFVAKNDLPVGTEIFGRSLTGFAMENWRVGALIALGAALSWPWSARQRASDHEIAVGTFAVATTALYVGAQRFAEYAMPFLALYLTILAARVQSLRDPSRLRHGVLALAVALGSLMSVQSTAAVVRFNHQRYGFSSLGEMDAFRNAVPAGARVAATWDFTPFYYFAAPGALYLNVLDPIFMWRRYPEAFTELERMYGGTTVDIAGVLLTSLGSDYVAYHKELFPDFATRIEHDPRFRLVFRSPGHNLARLDTVASAGFVTDWQLLRSTDSTFRSYRALKEVAAPEIQPAKSPAAGFVTPVVRGCWWASRTVVTRTGVKVAFGSAGPSTVFADGRLVYTSDVGHGGLIDAVSFETPVPQGSTQEWVVRNCPDPQYGSGFFWRLP